MTRKVWVVYVGKREYRLTPAQYDFMKKGSEEYGKQTFWFEKFTISLPHVSSMDLVHEEVPDKLALPSVSLEEKERSQKRIVEIKKKLSRKKPFVSKMTPEQIAERKALLQKQAEQIKYDN